MGDYFVSRGARFLVASLARDDMGAVELLRGWTGSFCVEICLPSFSPVIPNAVRDPPSLRSAVSWSVGRLV